MQTLEVQPQIQIRPTGLKSVTGGKTGAETARNGSSFLAVIEKMIAGTMEGAGGVNGMPVAKMAGRGAGDEKNVPGDDNTLIKPGSGKKILTAGIKKDTKVSLKGDSDAKPAKSAAKHAGFVAAGVDESSVEPIPVKARRGVPVNGGEKKASPEAALAATPAKSDEKKEIDPTQPAGDGSDKALLALMLKHQDTRPSETVAEAVPVTNAMVDGKLPAKDGAEQSVSVPVRSDRKDRKSFIDVRDNRTDADAAALAQSPLVKTTERNGDNSVDMSISFRTAQNGQSTAGETAKLSEKHDSDGQNFASMLSQELKNNASDFVKTGQIVLRDNNSGLIRLTLHPESLGNVKISLELSGDHKISGKIVVSSQEAYDAFNENLDGLSDAFVKGGFESAGFDLSWSGSGNDGGNQGRETQSAAVSPFYASSVPDVMSASETADTLKGGYRQQAFSAINIFA